jgi:AcrR family transcriptional regulator
MIRSQRSFYGLSGPVGKGIAKATLDDTRARTGTSKSQLFHYFPEGKDALLLAVAR